LILGYRADPGFQQFHDLFGNRAIGDQFRSPHRRGFFGSDAVGQEPFARRKVIHDHTQNGGLQGLPFGTTGFGQDDVIGAQGNGFDRSHGKQPRGQG